MAREKAADLASEARERAEEALEAAQEALERAQGAIEDGLDHAHRTLKREWRQRPLAITAGALGVGLVIGLLIGGRR